MLSDSILGFEVINLKHDSLSFCCQAFYVKFSKIL
jgi:hypothetical protein